MSYWKNNVISHKSTKLNVDEVTIFSSDYAIKRGNQYFIFKKTMRGIEYFMNYEYPEELDNAVKSGLAVRYTLSQLINIGRVSGAICV